MATEQAHVQSISGAGCSDAADTDVDIDRSTDAAINDPLFRHLSQTCTICELVGLKRVCKTWATMVTKNSLITAKARWEDGTNDWYFPVRLQIVRHLQQPGVKQWTWTGIHHPSGEVHTLPSLRHLPHDVLELHDRFFDCLLASTSSLLLLIHKQPMMSYPTNWRPLLVTNPLTQQSKILPQCYIPTSWEYPAMRAHMDIDEKTNSYKIILTFPSSLCVYTSTSNTWSFHSFPGPAPWGVSLHHSSRFAHIPSVLLNGNLFFAEVEVEDSPVILDSYDYDFLTKGCVRVFEVDPLSGTWKPPVRHKFLNYLPEEMYPNYGFRIGSYGMGLVECMGSLFALIPARLDWEIPMEEDIRRVNGIDCEGSYDSFGYLPIRFYVLRLQGDVGLNFGQLLVQIAHCDESEEWKEWRRRRRSSLGDFAVGDYLYMNPYTMWFMSRSLGWYRCCARGKVIWVTWKDYLVQYDVVSGRSSTRILKDGSFGEQAELAYRPSFYMKP